MTTSPEPISLARAGSRTFHWVSLDLFVLFNLALFLLMCLFSYYDRFVEYRGAANVLEFLVYALVIILGSVFQWVHFRKHPFDSKLLGLIQVGILLHYAGAFVEIGGARLYDHLLLGLRYDKLVHFANAGIIAALIGRLFRIRAMRRDLIDAVLIVVTVLGLGAIIEVVEYLVCLTIPDHGVGGYDNNMQDLIANLAGGVTSVLIQYGRVRD